MKETTASQTAVLPAIARAVHQVLDHEPKVCLDPVAAGLIEGTTEAEIAESAAFWRTEPNVLLRSVFIQRARYAEDCLEKAAGRGVSQFVVLGAGYDTIAYRQPPWTQRLTLFEVDHPATQHSKRERLEAGEIPVPDNLIFCPIDFETQTLKERLVDVGFSVSEPTLFSCLGVSQYLTRDALTSLWQFISSLPKGSGIVMTFIPPDSMLSGHDLDLVTMGRKVGSECGEAWITTFPPQKLTEEMKRSGFTHVHHFSPEDVQASYFAGRSDGLQAPHCEQLVWASV